MRRFPEDGLPVLMGYRGKKHPASLAVWCPYCRRIHYHGRVGVPGHRVAHCEAGPFHDKGYYILDITSAILKEIEKE